MARKSEPLEAARAWLVPWLIRQGYGLTETSIMFCSTFRTDIWFGSSGPLIPSIEAQTVDIDGSDAIEYDKPSELWVKGSAVTLGYLNNDKANKETFVADSKRRLMRTGDEALA
jgi:long-subunit acyl-CoA synthetase (AMP-forming)